MQCGNVGARQRCHMAPLRMALVFLSRLELAGEAVVRGEVAEPEEREQRGPREQA